MNSTPHPTRLRHRRRSLRPAATLVELVLSLTILTVLMGATTSIIIVASHAIPTDPGPTDLALEAMDVVDQMAGELFYATSISEATATAVTFTVANRGHGAPGPETIRYEWAGTAGDPLTRQYNGGTVVTVCDAAQQFDLAFSAIAGRLPGAPRVLLVVQSAGDPSNKDPQRQDAMESWGFTVQMISANATDAAFATAISTSDVLYVSATVKPKDIGTRLRDATLGVVNEEGPLADEFGIALSSTKAPDDAIIIVDNTHEITSVFPTGILTICSAPQDLMATRSTMAPGAEVLGEEASSLSAPMLTVIEVGGDLYGGGKATGRRVELPWGNSGGFDFDKLNANGLLLMRRAIVWAAAPVEYSSARIALQPTDNPSSRAETLTQILNTPKVNGP